ncbi:MAG TPA: succinate dehydrogenase assembly factor 2 [Caulobacteraceae bacterium]|nr:succinate dehydrogenase assembly factor 2 [Caulobacteraceae bacterium]
MPDARLDKLRYRAWRRGFREADLILGSFADARLAGLDPAAVDAFEHLLDQPDQDVWDWVVLNVPAPPSIDSGLIAQIRAFDVSGALRR